MGEGSDEMGLEKDATTVQCGAVAEPSQVTESSDAAEISEGTEEPEPLEEKEHGRKQESKSWFSIVLVAALTGIGSQIAVAGFKIAGQFIDDSMPKTIRVAAYVDDKNNRPISGARVELRDDTGERVVGAGSTNEHGAVAFEVRTQYGSYLLEIHHSDASIEYVDTDFLQISALSFSKKVKFDPDIWRKEAQKSAATERTSETIGVAETQPFQAQGPAWLATAIAQAGTTAAFPPTSNPKVIEYLSSVHDIKAENDTTPWSSAFVNWVLQQNNVVGTRSILDRPWLSWGRSVAPEPGCVAIFQWPDGGYHVAFVIKSDQASVTAIGGSVRSVQDLKSSVAIRVYSRRYLLGCRMPS
jgi:uncharacterized protein (TIGR02594 family)